MALTQILPPRDLLEQVEGVESGLRRGQRATLLGVLLGALQVTFLLANSQWLGELLSGDWSEVLDQWPLLVCLFLLALAVLLVGWSRFWLKESRDPFRYTYSIAPFAPLEGAKDQPLLVPLHADVRERLSERIKRLSLLEGGPAEAEPTAGDAEGTAPAQPESHFHISGTYAVRTRPPDRRWFVEVTPWVHLGGAQSAAQLATPVRYAVEAEPGGDAVPSPTPSEYEQILERTYFTIATAIYRQIEMDVDRKIELLPSRWFRASALFHEAADYAASNTLDAYQTASRLYWDAVRLYNPTWDPLPKAGVRRLLAKTRHWAARRRCGARRRLSRLIPRVGRADVLTARAQIGYANSLLDTGSLASLAGQRSRAAFAAAPIARNARDLLKALDRDVPDRQASLFEALVCVGQAETWLSAEERGIEALRQAQALGPRRAEVDPRYLYASAGLQPRLEPSISGFRDAVEHGDRFESALFDFAYSSEILWRTRPRLETSVARTVRAHYGDVLKVNPSNLAAWANRGYVAWLVGGEENLEKAKQCFDTGRRFKEIKRGTYVAELDHGLARVAAERGDFALAYSHYVDAVSARIAHGWGEARYIGYYYERISGEMLKRYKRYAAAVAEHYRTPGETQAGETTPRMRASVYAFALTDYAEACYEYYLADGDRTELDNAYRLLTKAAELNPRFVVPQFLLAKVERERRTLEPDEGDESAYLERVEELAPDWEEAAPLLLSWHSTKARESYGRAADLQGQASAVASRAALQDDQFGAGSTPTPDASAGPSFAQLRADAAKLEEEARRHHERALRLPCTLVPHDWLWKLEGVEPEFAWTEIGDEDARNCLKWQQSLELTHVWALMAWCRVMDEGPDAPHWLEDLLDLIQDRFLPGDFDLLTLRRDRERRMAESEEDPDGPHSTRARSYDELIARKVARALDANPRSFVNITWLDETTTPTAPRLEALAQDEGLSPFLYAWVGDRLIDRAERDDARARELAELALDRAMRANHARTLLEVGDGFNRLSMPDKALRSFRRAKGRARDPSELTVLADRLVACDEQAEALELYTRARAKDAGPAPRHRPEHYAAAVGRLLWATGDRDSAMEELDGIPRSGGELGTGWRRLTVGTLLGVAPQDPDAYLRLRAWLASAHRGAVLAGDDGAARDCADAAGYLAESGIGYPQEAAPSFAAMIRLDASSIFYPQGEQTPAVQRMINVDIPSLRDRVRDASGVVLPGVRLRSDETVPERAYTVLIVDVPVETGTVPADVADPYRFMLDRVADAALARLPAFLDLQALEAMMAAAGFDSDEVLPGYSLKRRFVRFLRSLIADGVPVNDLELLLQRFAHGSASAATNGLVHEIRSALRDRLIGRDAPRLELPRALEERIASAVTEAGGQLEQLDEGVLTELRWALRSASAGAGPSVAIITSQELRDPVRRLAEAELPLAHVFSREELESQEVAA